MTVSRLDAYDAKGAWIGAWDDLSWPLTWALDLARQTWPGAVRVKVDGKEHNLRGEAWKS